MTALEDLEPRLSAVPGRVSVWCGPVGGPSAYARLAGETHDAASTMKLAVLLAAHRLADRGELDLDERLVVHPDFSSRVGTGRFSMGREDDGDQEAWARLGERVPVGWLLRRMIVRSGNLATNLVLERVGFEAVAEAWQVCGATASTVARLLEDTAANGEEIRNLVTAADLAAVLGAVALDRVASPAACAAIRELLTANEFNPDVPAGLPAGTKVAHKNGWVPGIRHDAALVTPGDAVPYVLVVCTSSELTDGDACALVAEVAAASWRDRG